VGAVARLVEAWGEMEIPGSSHVAYIVHSDIELWKTWFGQKPEAIRMTCGNWEVWVKQLEASFEVVIIHILNTLFCVKNVDSVNSV